MVHAMMCPQCNAPLAPHRFSRSVVCAYCGATVQLDESSVSAALFHETFRTWNSPDAYQASSWVSMGNRYWALEKLIAHGDIADVYSGQLARYPTELVIVKVLRDPKDAEQLNNEWDIVQLLQKSDAPGADSFTMLLPQPVVHGEIAAGLFTGQRASIFRWISGFHHSFEDVFQAYPQGIPPQASIWVWRRILELLSFIHTAGVVHGAVIPAHLLVQDNEHGVRLIGYGSAGRLYDRLRFLPANSEPFYPRQIHLGSKLTPQLDLILSARSIAALLGGDPETVSLPEHVPIPLANIVQRIATSDPDKVVSDKAWAIREELGQIAKDVFGPPCFMPIVMPS